MKPRATLRQMPFTNTAIEHAAHERTLSVNIQDRIFILSRKWKAYTGYARVPACYKIEAAKPFLILH